MYFKLYDTVMEAMETIDKGLNGTEELYISDKKTQPFGLLKKKMFFIKEIKNKIARKNKKKIKLARD